METNNGKQGGLLKGNSHAQNGGMKAIVTNDGNKPVLLEGDEVIINRHSVNSDKIYSFEGKEMTAKQVLSEINTDGGYGVPIFEHGGNIPRAKRGCHCNSFERGGKISNSYKFHSIKLYNTNNEIFNIWCLEFDVNNIYKKIENNEIKYEIKNIEVFNPQEYHVKIDADYAIKLKPNYNEPVGIFFITNGESPFLIDGNHRMYRAWLDGIKKVKVYVVKKIDISQIKENKPLNKINELTLQNKNLETMKIKTKKYNKTDYKLAKQLIASEFSKENIEDAFTLKEIEKLAIIIHKLKQKGIGDYGFTDLIEHDEVQDCLTNLSASYKNKMAKGGKIKETENVKKVKALLKKENVDPEYASPHYVFDFAFNRGIKNLTTEEVVRISNSYGDSEEMEKGGKINNKMNPKIKELKEKIADYQFKYDSAKKNNLQAGMDFAQKKIDGLTKELETFEAEEAKNAFKEDVAKEKGVRKIKPKSKKTKIVNPEFNYIKIINWNSYHTLMGKVDMKINGEMFAKYKANIADAKGDADKIEEITKKEADRIISLGGKVKYKGDKKPEKAEHKEHEKNEHRKLSPNHELYKISETVYTVKNIKTDKAEFDIEKKGNNWEVVCLTKEHLFFKTLDEAVAHVSKELRKGVYKEIIEQKKKALKHSRAFRAKHPKGVTTPAEDIKKAVTKTTEKIKEKVENGESINKQIEAIVNQIIDLLKTIKKLGADASVLNKIKKAL